MQLSVVKVHHNLLCSSIYIGRVWIVVKRVHICQDAVISQIQCLKVRKDKLLKNVQPYAIAKSFGQNHDLFDKTFSKDSDLG